jgi:lysozyme
MLKGIDVSHYQRFDNYEMLNHSQLAFVFIKATEGIYKDRDFAIHSNGFAKTCLLKGAYHFFRFKTDPKEQAKNFIDTVKPLHTPLDLPPVLDIEDTREEIKTVQECEQMIQVWLDDVQQAFGQPPIIYSGGWYWTDPVHLNNTAAFSRYPLWTSRYSKSGYQPMYGGWQKPTFWQFTDKGTIDGLEGNNAAIDLDYFLGEIEDLWKLTKASDIKPSNTTEPKIMAVQHMLNSKKFNCGTPDGIFGDFTLTAYQNWLKSNRLPVEDRITPQNWQLLFGLGVGSSVPALTDAQPVTTAATTATGATATSGKFGIVTANKLNIRAGAGVENMMIAQPLNKGQQVVILEEKDGWVKVKTDIVGWVTKNYLS